MSFFDKKFPGVMRMLEDEVRARHAAPHKPWCITGLLNGVRVVQESFDTEAEAQARYLAILDGRPPWHWTIADLRVEKR